MSDFKIDENAPIFIEFAVEPGVRSVAISPADIAEKSKEAVDSAMNTIHNMASRVITTIEGLVQRPSAVEVSFGLKFDAKTGVIVAKAGIEASINVKLTWQSK